VISGLSVQGRELMDRLWAAGREGLDEVLAALAPEDIAVVERAFKLLVDAVTKIESSPQEEAVGSAEG